MVGILEKLFKNGISVRKIVGDFSYYLIEDNLTTVEGNRGLVGGS